MHYLCYHFSYRYISICTGLLYFHGSIDLYMPTQNKGWRYITILLLITSLHDIPSQVLRHIDESLEFDLGCYLKCKLVVSPHCIYLHTIFAHTNTSKRKIKRAYLFCIEFSSSSKTSSELTKKLLEQLESLCVHNTKQPVKNHPKS